MDRTNAPGSVDRRYVDEDRNVGVQGTAIIAADRNAVQEELIHLIEGGGLAPNTGDETQLLQAVREIARAMPPVGTIWMYDGAGWVDNVTLPGWYACIPENEDGGANGLSFGIRSMVDRFVIGGSPVTAGTVGGVNSYQLTVDQLPAHSHAINHDHTAFSSGEDSPNHTHALGGSIGGGSHDHLAAPVANDGQGVPNLAGFGTAGGAGQRRPTEMYGRSRTNVVWARTSSTSHSHNLPATTGSRSVAHTHQINVPAYSGNSGSTGLNQAIDNRPAHYTMIYIRKCH